MPVAAAGRRPDRAARALGQREDDPLAGADQRRRAAATTTAGVRTACLSYVYEGLPAKLGLVRGTRHQRLRQEPGGPTSYDTVEEFSGPLVRFAGPDRVAEGFRRHAAGLKQRAEELARSRG